MNYIFCACICVPVSFGLCSFICASGIVVNLFDETQVQERFEVLKKRKDLGSFTEQGKALDKRRD